MTSRIIYVSITFLKSETHIDNTFNFYSVGKWFLAKALSLLCLPRPEGRGNCLRTVFVIEPYIFTKTNTTNKIIGIIMNP